MNVFYKTRRAKFYTNTYLLSISFFSLLSLWASLDLTKTSLLYENIAPKSFEFFSYLLFIFTGLSMLSKTNLINFFSSMTKQTSAIFTGWGIGLTLAEMFHLHWKYVFIGIALTIVVSLFTYLPTFLSLNAYKIVQQTRTQLFRKKNAFLGIELLAYVFISCGGYGLYTFIKGF